ncbi:DUF6093 family protein [Streptomyces sp. NPDC020719]|uniref:DUF6093 family protein n=1 Tax=Streptomyces sp. NPDC020719 TaxID=3154896 RepID=UPI0033D5C7CE
MARFAERHLMPDRVRVTRDGSDDLLDPDTGRLVPAPDRVVHEGQAGLYGQQERIRSRSGRGTAWVEEVRPAYRMLFPLSAPEFREGDTVTVLEARDEHAVGRTYRVSALDEVSSVPVLRTVRVEEHNRKKSS